MTLSTTLTTLPGRDRASPDPAVVRSQRSERRGGFPARGSPPPRSRRARGDGSPITRPFRRRRARPAPALAWGPPDGPRVPPRGVVSGGWSTNDATRLPGRSCSGSSAGSAWSCRRRARPSTSGTRSSARGGGRSPSSACATPRPASPSAPTPSRASCCWTTTATSPTPYIHQHGWVTRRLAEPVDWDEVEQHLLDSYRLQALKRMLRALDA